MIKSLIKILKGIPLRLQGAEGIEFGKTELDYLCINYKITDIRLFYSGDYDF